MSAPPWPSWRAGLSPALDLRPQRLDPRERRAIGLVEAIEARRALALDELAIEVADEAVEQAAVRWAAVEQRGLDVAGQADAVERLLHRPVDQRRQHREEADGEGVIGAEPR